MNVGMCGAGVIATRLSKTFVGMKDSNIKTYAIASAFPEQCPEFVEKYGWERWYETYDELMSDPKVDIIYVAVPNPFHYPLSKMALEHGKPVICEKPFCVSEAQARELYALAEEKGLFITEAVWTNYMPSIQTLKELLASGVIGQVTEVDIRLKSWIIFKERLISKEYAGGALLDLGPYTFAVMTSLFGYDIKLMKPNFTYLPTGVDGEDDILFEYKNGIKVRIRMSCASNYDERNFDIYGTEGKIFVEGTTNPKVIHVYNMVAQETQTIHVPEQITGYEYEFEACERALAAGLKEAPEMPHEQTLWMLRMFDTLREIAGIHYPCEGVD